MSELTPKKKLVEYFKKNISKGYSQESLKWALIRQGYSRTDVSGALEQAKKEIEDKKTRQEREKKPDIKYEVYDAENNSIKIPVKKSFWKKLLGL